VNKSREFLVGQFVAFLLDFIKFSFYLLMNNLIFFKENKNAKSMRNNIEKFVSEKRLFVTPIR